MSSDKQFVAYSPSVEWHRFCLLLFLGLALTFDSLVTAVALGLLLDLGLLNLDLAFLALWRARLGRFV